MVKMAGTNTDRQILDAFNERFSDIDEFDTELKNLKRGLAVKVGDEIEVNDWGVVAKIVPDKTKGKNINRAYLVMEEDGSIRWYINPDTNSDTLVNRVSAKKLRAR